MTSGDISAELARLSDGAIRVIRLFGSSIHPADIDVVRTCFLEDVRPAFERAEGCLGIELAISSTSSSSGMVEGTAISRWDSMPAMEAAVESRDLQESQVRIKQYLRSLPLIQVFAVLE